MNKFIDFKFIQNEVDMVTTFDFSILGAFFVVIKKGYRWREPTITNINTICLYSILERIQCQLVLDKKA